jgi:hypothetical protein
MRLVVSLRLSPWLSLDGRATDASRYLLRWEAITTGERERFDDLSRGLIGIVPPQDRQPSCLPPDPRLAAPLPSFAVVAQALDSLAEAGRGDQDQSALVTLIEDPAGVRLAAGDCDDEG